VVYTEGAHAPVALGHNNSLFAAGARAGIVQCELLSGRLLTLLNGHLGAVQALAAHPREPLLFSAARDATLLAWHPQSANRHYTPLVVLQREEAQAERGNAVK
jgi:hypothetical protein